MAFSENEGRQVRTFRVSFREMTRIFAALGGFNLGWHWLLVKEIPSFLFVRIVNLSVPTRL